MIFSRLNRIARKFATRTINRDGRKFLLDFIDAKSVGAEIGVWKGQFSKMILRYGRIQKYYLIDPYEFMPHLPNRWYGGKLAKSQKDMDQIFDDVSKELRAYGGNKIFIRERSEVGHKKIPDNELDFVYIDGNHYYDGVLSDLRNFFPKVKSGGYLFLDDWSWKDDDGAKSVRQATLHFLSENCGSVQLLKIERGQAILIKLRDI